MEYIGENIFYETPQKKRTQTASTPLLSPPMNDLHARVAPM